MFAKIKNPWQRLLAEWAVASFWFFIFAPTIGIAWYSLSSASPFDEVIAALKDKSLSPSSAGEAVRKTVDQFGHVQWALRVGGHSWYREGVAYKGSTMGLSLEPPGQQQRHNKVWNGEYTGTYEATYLASFDRPNGLRGLVVVRNIVASPGEQFEIHVLDLRQVLDLALFCILAAAVAVAFLEGWSWVQARKKKGGATSLR